MARLALIVEDSETCAETLQIALESIDGLEVRVVPNPRAAIAQLNEAEIAAIITDLHMPQSDGLDLIRQLRAEPRFSRLPILLISGDSDPSLPARALANGADAFFAKPYSPAAVRRKLEQLLCLNVS
jgi:two-component system chemotaxis response regulator CheY